MTSRLVIIIFLSLALLIASGCNFVSQSAIPTRLATESSPSSSALTVEEQESAAKTEVTASPITASPSPGVSPTHTATMLPSPTIELPVDSATPSPTNLLSASATNQSQWNPIRGHPVY
jgi:hypothetical protein